MCLYPRFTINRKYTSTKKNGGKIPIRTDDRIKYVPIGCGECIECLKMKQRDWSIRLYEEIARKKNGKFVTLTYSDEALNRLKYIAKTDDINKIVTLSVRRFLERWRQKNKKSVRHWLVTELGDKNNRIHLHGILFTEKNKEYIEEVWSYGYVGIGNYVNEKTINYITKYSMKINEKNRDYKPIILCSPGIGRGYENSYNASLNAYNGEKTKEYYITKKGKRISLPIYYRNKIYTEEEREKLWINKLNKKEVYVLGVKYDISTVEGINKYNEALHRGVNKSIELGYQAKKYDRIKYKEALKKLNL